MAKSCTLRKDCGMYDVTVDGKQTRLPVTKPIVVNGATVMKTTFIPMTAMLIKLTHINGGTVTFKQTTMGKRTTVTRETDLTKGTRINKEATGPATIETGTKPMGLKVDVAIGQVLRMTGLNALEAAQLFDFDAVLAAGILVEAVA
jgi:carbonic anhydrase/acetyltransferase-like protein (isoleucine patch superfamily)